MQSTNESSQQRCILRLHDTALISSSTPSRPADGIDRPIFTIAEPSIMQERQTIYLQFDINE